MLAQGINVGARPQVVAPLNILTRVVHNRGTHAIYSPGGLCEFFFPHIKDYSDSPALGYRSSRLRSTSRTSSLKASTVFTTTGARVRKPVTPIAVSAVLCKPSNVVGIKFQTAHQTPADTIYHHYWHPATVVHVSDCRRRRCLDAQKVRDEKSYLRVSVMLGHAQMQRQDSTRQRGAL